MKFVIAVLVVAVLGVGGYLIYSQTQVKTFPQSLTIIPQPTSVSQAQVITPSPTTSLEEDLTALDRDLQDILTSEGTFTQDIQGL